MKHEIKNLSPDVPFGGGGSFDENGIHYAIDKEPENNKAGSVMVSMVTSSAVKKEKGRTVLCIPEAVKHHNEVYQVIGICGAAIGGDITELHLPPTLRVFSGFSFCNCTVGSIIIDNPETDEPNRFFKETKNIIVTDYSGERLIYASTNIPINAEDWRGVKIIGEYALCHYKGTEITIPYGVEYIEPMAFASCENLRTVYFVGQLPCGITTSAFHNIYKNICIKLLPKP